MCWEQTPSSNTVRPVPSRHITGQHKQKRGSILWEEQTMSYNKGRRSSLPSRPNKQQGDCQACSDVNNAAGNRTSMQQRGGSPNVQGTSPRNQRSWQQAKHATMGWKLKCSRDKPKKPTQLATGQACNNGVEPQMFKGQAQEINAAGDRPSMQQRGGTPNVQGTSPRNQRSWQQAKHATKGWNPKCTRDKPKNKTTTN